MIILGSHSTNFWTTAKKQSMFLVLHVLQITSQKCHKIHVHHPANKLFQHPWCAHGV
jgi:hypothetical protein